MRISEESLISFTCKEDYTYLYYPPAWRASYTYYIYKYVEKHGERDYTKKETHV